MHLQSHSSDSDDYDAFEDNQALSIWAVVATGYVDDEVDNISRYFNGLKNDFLARNDSDAVSIAYNVLGGFYNRLGLHEKSEYNMLKSLEFLNNRQPSAEYQPAETLLGKIGKVNRYSVLGSYSIDNGKPKEAEIYLSEAIKIY